MGFLDYFLNKSSEDSDEHSSIKIPSSNNNSAHGNGNNIGGSDDDEDEYIDREVEVVEEEMMMEKIHDPKEMMEVLQVVKDSVLEFIPIHEIVNLQFSCKYFKELVDLFLETRSALWWSICWKRIFNYTKLEENRIRFGYIRSMTENTSTFNHFYASSLSIEEELKLFPFVLEGSDEVAKVKEEELKAVEQLKLKRNNYRELQGQFIGKEERDSFKISQSKAKKLLGKKGVITQFISMPYSSTGKSGSAEGEFSKTFLLKNVKRNYFEEEQGNGKSKFVELANSSLRFIFWTLFNKWWARNKNSNQNLIVQVSTIKRNKLASHDRYGPVHRNETIEILSLVHQTEGKSDTVIGTYVKHRSYYA